MCSSLSGCSTQSMLRNSRGLLAWESAPGCERKSTLVKLLGNFVERLLTEVGDCQQVIDRLLEQLANGIDLSTLEAVAGTFGKFEIFDWRSRSGEPLAVAVASATSRPSGSSLISSTSWTMLRSVAPAEARASRRRDRTIGLDVSTRRSREDCVDRNEANGATRCLVLQRRDSQRHARWSGHTQAGLLIEGCNNESGLRISTSGVVCKSAAVTVAGPATSRRNHDWFIATLASHIDPRRRRTVNDVVVPLERVVVFALGRTVTNIALTKAVATNVHTTAIYIDVAVVYELTSLRTRSLPNRLGRRGCPSAVPGTAACSRRLRPACGSLPCRGCGTDARSGRR
ncbi:hypothetical protein GQR58_029935 [Nymphon striatum]|nr:hypothetical protein GQR58_029935 [Nymphon striatum]